jgi:5-(carboxyamino)imidazole ribonucleotide synthase
MVGLLAVEFFLDKSGNVLVNEMAPRPHNSGHHTIEGNICSQFQQFWRSILNFPLSETDILFPFSAMLNMIGEPGFTGAPVYQGIERCLSLSGAYPHIYGKAETRPYRKMGHVTVVANSLADLQQKVSFVQNHLKVIS